MKVYYQAFLILITKRCLDIKITSKKMLIYTYSLVVSAFNCLKFDCPRVQMNSFRGRAVVALTSKICHHQIQK